MDFTQKVFDAKGKLIGVLDFNNMIPVNKDLVEKSDITIQKSDDAATKHYKNLIKDQLTFCQQNQDAIIKKANKLYKLVYKKNVSGNLKRRCLDYKKLEEALSKFKI